MSTRWCAANCAASTTTRAPRRWATATTSATGSSSPVTLLAPVIATSAWRVRTAASAASMTSGTSPARGGVGDVDDGMTAPRQQVGVMLEIERDDRRVVGQGAGEQVQRIGGVARPHHHVVAAGADEAADAPTRRVECVAADGRGEAGAAMHAGVPRQEGGDRVGDGAQWRRTGRMVEVDKPSGSRRDHRNLQVGTDHVGQRARDGGIGEHGHERAPDSDRHRRADAPIRRRAVRTSEPGRRGRA